MAAQTVAAPKIYKPVVQAAPIIKPVVYKAPVIPVKPVAAPVFTPKPVAAKAPVAASTPIPTVAPNATPASSFNSLPVHPQSAPLDPVSEKELNKNLQGNKQIDDILESFAKKPIKPVVAAPVNKTPDMASLEASVSKIANYLKTTTI